MSFTPEKLKGRFRTDVDDAVGGSQGEDFLWSDEEIFEYMDEAQRVFVRRTHLLRKAFPFTPTLTSLAFTASGATGFLSNSPKIIKTLNARMTTNANADPLTVVSFEELNTGFFMRDYGLIFTGDWQGKTGPARFLVTNMQEDMYRLVPIPTIDDVLELIVEHLPLNDVTEASTVLEVTEREDQKTILLLMKSLAFLKQDADVYDKELSEKFEAAFERKAEDRRREIRRQRFRAGSIKYGGIPLG